MAENVFAVSQSALSGPPRVIDIDRDAWELQGRLVPGNGKRLLSCGRFLQDVEVKIIRRDGESLGEREAGEIVIRSPFLFSGYYRQQEKTERALRGGWYHTGDLGVIESGELFVAGRVDDLLIAFGRNYYAHDIEALASAIEGLIPGRNVAFAIESESVGTQQIVLVAETREPGDRSLARTIKEAIHAASGLSLHDVFLCDPGWLVKTTSGKISRNGNSEKYRSATSGRGQNG